MRVLNWTRGWDRTGFAGRVATDGFDMPQNALATGGWQFEPQAERDLLARLRARGTPLGEWCAGRFYYGIKTGLNDAFVLNDAEHPELIGCRVAFFRRDGGKHQGFEIVALVGDLQRQGAIRPPMSWSCFSRGAEGQISRAVRGPCREKLRRTKNRSLEGHGKHAPAPALRPGVEQRKRSLWDTWENL